MLPPGLDPCQGTADHGEGDRFWQDSHGFASEGQDGQGTAGEDMAPSATTTEDPVFAGSCWHRQGLYHHYLFNFRPLELTALEYEDDNGASQEFDGEDQDGQESLDESQGTADHGDSAVPEKLYEKAHWACEGG